MTTKVMGTAIMCAERVYFQCHRMLVSDYLTAHGHTVRTLTMTSIRCGSTS